MLAHSERLRAHEVAEVLARGRSARAENIHIKFVPAAALRIAAVVPKSLARKANKRNALRRAVYRAIAASPLPRPKILAVCMVRVIPQKPAEAFARDIAVIFSKL